MQVYMVCGGYNYEGVDGDSIKLFDSKAMADDYYFRIRDEWNYDYAEIKVMPVLEWSQAAA